MNRALAVAALMGCAAFGASGTLHAQARGPVSNESRASTKQAEGPAPLMDEAARARKITEMETWLGRLPGLYRVEATRTWRDSFAARDETHEHNGTANCSRIGAGPGVRCIIRLIHLPPVVPPHVKLSPHLTSVTWSNLVRPLPVLYFGINADTLEIQAAMVDLEQVSARSGMLEGNAVSFSADRWNICHRGWTVCWTVREVTAAAPEEIFMKIAMDAMFAGPGKAVTKSGHSQDTELHLHREPASQGKKSGSMPRNYEGQDWREAHRTILEVFDLFKSRYGGANIKELSDDIGREELDLILRQTLDVAEEMNQRYVPKGQYMVQTFDMVPRRQPADSRLHCQWVYDGRSNTFSVFLYQDAAAAPKRDMADNNVIRKL
jgi:hypothetical protein